MNDSTSPDFLHPSDWEAINDNHMSLMDNTIKAIFQQMALKIMDLEAELARISH